MQVLLDLAARLGPSKEGVLATAERLPSDPAEVDKLLEAASRTPIRMTFLTVGFAVLHSGWELPARHLAVGLGNLKSDIALMALAWRATGDVPGILLGLVDQLLLPAKLRIPCLLVAARWIRERGSEHDMGSVAVRMRLEFRHTTPQDLLERTLLAGVVHYVRDDVLCPNMEADKNAALFLPRGTEWVDVAFEIMDKPLLNLLGERWDLVGEGGTTIRRPSRKVGRNEPCPCGSGLKYKHCCIDKDRERSVLASGKTGLTLAEADANREALLTAGEIEKLGPAELRRLDPARVRPELHEPLAIRLCATEQLDAVVRLFETVPYTDPLGQTLRYATFMAASKRDAEAMNRLLATDGGKTIPEDEKPASVRLLGVERDAEQYLALAEALASEAVDDGQNLSMLAFALLSSPMPNLGIIVARAAILSTDNNGCKKILLHDLLQVRDRKGKAFRDPVQEVLDKLAEVDAVEEPGDDTELEDRLRQSQGTESRLKEQVAELQGKLARAEKRALRRPSPTAAAGVDGQASALPDPRVAKLKEELDAVQELLRSAHEERAELRKSVREAQEKAEQERSQSPPPSPPAADESDDDEDEGWTSNRDPKDRPARLPQFSRNFRDSLDGVPLRVVRACHRRIGWMCSGEAAAFLGEVKLEHRPEYRRLHIQKDWRLLYRDQGVLEFERLVHKSKLDQEVRRLPG